jgi:uncharacterized protein YcbK (DUF882 family)
LGLPQSSANPRGDGTIRVYNYHLDEFAEIKFRDGDKFLQAGLDQFNHLLRSRNNSEEIKINPKLLDLIDYLQHHFGADTIEIISGYRTKEFNNILLKTGHKVSPISLHTKGEALDIHIDEIREETLRDYILGLKLGGVGYYGPLDFVHIDTGPERTWGESEYFQRKLVGVLDPQAPAQLTSDKNDYLPGETLNFTWDLKEGLGWFKIKEVKLEHFWRGKWISCEISAEKKKSFELPTTSILCPGKGNSEFGKFRWTFELDGDDKQLSSNEFYLKKQ